MLTPPVFLLLAGLQFAVGALVAACSQSWMLLLWPMAIGPLLSAFFLSSERQWQDGEAKCGLPETGVIVVLCVVVVLGFAYANWRFPKEGKNDLSRFAGKHIYLEGRVESALPLKSSGHARFICTAQSALLKKRMSKFTQCDGTTLLLLKRTSFLIGKLKSKTHFRCACTVVSIDDVAKRGKGGYANYLRRSGITSQCYLDDRQNSFVWDEASGTTGDSPAERVSEGVEQLRGRLIAVHVQNLGQKVGSLLTAMVLGEKAVGLDPELLTSFRNVGLSHVLAASGFNLTVVTFSTHWICRVLCMPAVVTNFMSFLMMSVFVLFAGNSSSVVRASLMCALAIACSCLSRRVHIGGLLGATLILSVLIDPLSVADPGFQLSYTAVSGIIFVVSPLAAHLEESVQRRWLRWSLDCLLTVLVAQACVLPLQLYYFKQIGLLFLPANILASLIVTPVTVSGFASSLLVLLINICPYGAVLAPPLLWLASLFDWLASVPLNLLLYVVALLSSCRWALITVPPIAVWHVILYYLGFVVFSAMLLDHLRKEEKFDVSNNKKEAL